MAIYYKKGHPGFYDTDYPEAFALSGFDQGDMTEISKEDYDRFFSNEDGFYQDWSTGDPLLLPYVINFVLQAQQEKDRLISEANSATYPISLKLQMGRKLTQAESERVNAWMDYTDALDAIDLSLAPNISWPEAPNV